MLVVEAILIMSGLLIEQCSFILVRAFSDFLYAFLLATDYVL